MAMSCGWCKKPAGLTCKRAACLPCCSMYDGGACSEHPRDGMSKRGKRGAARRQMRFALTKMQGIHEVVSVMLSTRKMRGLLPTWSRAQATAYWLLSSQLIMEEPWPHIALQNDVALQDVTIGEALMAWRQTLRLFRPQSRAKFEQMIANAHVLFTRDGDGWALRPLDPPVAAAAVNVRRSQNRTTSQCPRTTVSRRMICSRR